MNSTLAARPAPPEVRPADSLVIVATLAAGLWVDVHTDIPGQTALSAAVRVLPMPSEGSPERRASG
jgi:hypothetical protein